MAVRPRHDGDTVVSVWGQAKIEFIALRDEIRDEHLTGKSKNRIYREFRASGRLTMSQRSFYYWFDRLSSNTHLAQNTLPVPAPIKPRNHKGSVAVRVDPRPPAKIQNIDGRLSSVSTQLWDDDDEPQHLKTEQ
ncbi:MAG TPA: hypothetical protein DHR80_13005 [Thalassospira lucentensis]|uniref:Uncharacterized protein n=1 Tax=Thalassospira lucentensis TaxID=168935 RepID=A0A3D5NBU1_9PROT|nr:hypothetical protein [Thalassospira lucentensis]